MAGDVGVVGFLMGEGVVGVEGDGDERDDPAAMSAGFL
jgi:hypothetical protein